MKHVCHMSHLDVITLANIMITPILLRMGNVKIHSYSWCQVIIRTIMLSKAVYSLCFHVSHGGGALPHPLPPNPQWPLGTMNSLSGNPNYRPEYGRKGYRLPFKQSSLLWAWLWSMVDLSHYHFLPSLFALLNLPYVYASLLFSGTTLVISFQ